MSDFFKQVFIADLDSQNLKIKVLISGVVVDMKVREKFAKVIVDDSTGVIDCILFKSSDKKPEITVGMMLTISGEFEL
jgi:hypothetical protein